MPKKILIALPPAMLEEIDYIAAAEHRTRSDLLREGMRRYIKAFKVENGQRVQSTMEVSEPYVPDFPAEEPDEIDPSFDVVQFPTNSERMQFTS